MSFISKDSISEGVSGFRKALRAGTSRIALFHSFRRDESGAFSLFGLYMFLLMVMIGGMAVDLMRFETKRVKLQGTLDTATLAATNLQQTIDSELLVRDFMAKRGYDPDLVHVDVEPVYLGGNVNGQVISRRVEASYDLDMNTFFMHMLNINTLSTTTGSAAMQGVQNVEISLVLDISGSMNGTKIAALKEAASSFVRSVIDESRTDAVTSISVIPYNHTIVVPDTLLDRLNTQGTVMIDGLVNPVPEGYEGRLTQYPRTSENSKCVRFYDDQLVTDNLAADYADLRAITPTTVLDRMAYYDPDSKSAGFGDSYARPADDWNRRCDPTRGAILPFETSISALETHINNLYADGMTAIDNGMKWATALLDPAMRPVVNDMVANGLLPSSVQDRPGDYDPNATMKVIVLMTDGANTSQYDLENDKKSGPSRIWFSEKASSDHNTDPTKPANNNEWVNLYIVDSNEDGIRDREKQWYDGYYVEMPDNPESERFMRQHRLGTSGSNERDAVLYGVSEVPDDLVQLDYTALYDRFSERAVAEFFRDDYVGDWSALNDHWNAENTVENGSSADRRLSGSPRTSSTEFGICDAAKYVRPGEDQPDIVVFSIAFSAGSHAENVMRDCATNSEFFYNANDEDELREAFAAIAGAITMLKLTQ